MDLTQDDGFVLLVTSNGYGKKVAVSEFRPQGRGGQGLKSIILSDKTGGVADARRLLMEKEEIALVSSDGAVMRCGLGKRACDQAGGGRVDHHAHGRGRWICCGWRGWRTGATGRTESGRGDLADLYGLAATL